MGKRFMIAFGLMAGYMVVPVLGMLLAVAISGGAEEVALIGVAVALLLVVGFFPWMMWVIRKVFTFRSTATPVSEQQLQATLLTINNHDNPFTVLQHGPHKLVLTLRYADAAWWQIFARAGLSRVYELHMKFIPARQLVRVIDIQKNVDWRAGPQQVKLSASFSRGILFSQERAVQWGITDFGRLGEQYKYRFSSEEIKGPVMKTILEHGWTVQFAVW